MNTDIRRPLPAPTAPTKDLIERSGPATTTASQLSDLAEAAGSLRLVARFAHEDKIEHHQTELFRAWQQRTAVRGRSAPSPLLDELADLGFAWRDVARMLAVSVPAVQKWRRSGGVTGENRRRLAGLLAMCDEITTRYHVQEIASWFEMSIVSAAPVTPADMYAAGRPELVLEYASGHTDPEQILTAYDPDWREHFRSNFEVYVEADGEMSIRPKGQ
ncbi:hypothetical protein NMG29_06575 [Streptomyces cocklensis]|uniref:Uncharacterized protein n=1 Tax=Actinacidiphila cocklensis TaxID=887465 RepID=A0A9W4GQK2_9ACTN|nr:hypothetical protein [Actinacidiphila cocklensis]MDD1057896.1 hypothetical protein [Actinacidiphila cocklensis]CAG6392759.1 conserved hypothetical protein [Actinacidiphila cocklensis]